MDIHYSSYLIVNAFTFKSTTVAGLALLFCLFYSAVSCKTCTVPLLWSMKNCMWYQNRPDHVPPRAVVLCQASIQETAYSYNGSHDQHISVKAQPSKIDSNFFSIVLPVEEKGFFLKCKWIHISVLNGTSFQIFCANLYGHIPPVWTFSLWKYYNWVFLLTLLCFYKRIERGGERKGRKGAGLSWNCAQSMLPCMNW